MSKQLNSSLKKRQEELRNETCRIIENAIKELQEEGFVINTKLLMERTGFSRPVFGKKHVLEVLKKYSVCRYKNIKMISKDNSINYINDLEKRVQKLIKERDKAKEMLVKMVRINSKLELDIQDIKESNEILRGNLKTYYEKAMSFGIDLEGEDD